MTKKILVSLSLFFVSASAAKFCLCRQQKKVEGRGQKWQQEKKEEGGQVHYYKTEPCYHSNMCPEKKWNYFNLHLLKRYVLDKLEN